MDAGNLEVLCHTIFEESVEGILLVKVVTRHIVESNRAIQSMLGYSEREMADFSLENLIVCDPDMVTAYVQQVIRTRQHAASEWQYKTKSGDPLDVEVSATAVDTQSGGVVCLVVRDISQRRVQEKILQNTIYHDPLTGLPTRPIFYDRLKTLISNQPRNPLVPTVLFLDLDSFKRVNDTLGHDAGDKLIQQVSVRLSGCLHAGDTVARLGGDEFIFLCPQRRRIEYGAIVAKKIIQAFSTAFVVDGREIYLSGSIGIAHYPYDGDDADSLMKHAAAAMYRAKEKGKNNYQFYLNSMNAAAYDRLALENSLHHAIERDELLLHYQPQTSIETGEILGIEALVRWRHPSLGIIPPGEFIPLAEETGLILPMGEWVLRTTCLQNKQWTEVNGWRLRISVNLSAKQLEQKNFVERVSKIIAETGLSPELLELEITESAVMKDVTMAMAHLNQLAGMGFRLSMDDFGTGYSSLSYLKRFPLSTLKVDRSFVQEITTSSDDQAITLAIISMAHHLGMNVIAEGVETSAQLGLLKSYQCDAIQGFLISKPLPVEDIEKFVEHQSGSGLSVR